MDDELEYDDRRASCWSRHGRSAAHGEVGVGECAVHAGASIDDSAGSARESRSYRGADHRGAAVEPTDEFVSISRYSASDTELPNVREGRVDAGYRPWPDC